MYSKYLKHIFDFIFTITLLILLSPVFFIITVILLIANKGKAFYVQKRPGKNEKIFKLIKFKTMNDKKNKSGELLPPAERITFFGRFLRKSSLDEIPQLFNVLKGDMSIIGPRPLLVEYLTLYNKIQKRRHEARPGITGWAQVNGRNAISWEKKFEYDVWYVENISFILDIKIFFMTLKKVLFRENINKSDKVTMERFKGSSK